MAVQLNIKRIYEEPSDDDGYRLFIDRLWARGVKKDAAHIDDWAMVLTPSHELRKWFHANPTQHEEFARRYLTELHSRSDEIAALLSSITSPRLTLVTATKDLERGHSAILKSFLHDWFREHR